MFHATTRFLRTLDFPLHAKKTLMGYTGNIGLELPENEAYLPAPDSLLLCSSPASVTSLSLTNLAVTHLSVKLQVLYGVAM